MISRAGIAQDCILVLSLLIHTQNANSRASPGASLLCDVNLADELPGLPALAGAWPANVCGRCKSSLSHALIPKSEIFAEPDAGSQQHVALLVG